MNNMQKSPADKIKLPAVALLVIGIMGLVSALYSTLDVIFGFTAATLDTFDLPPEALQMIAAASSYGLVGVAINVIGSSFLVWSALRMIKLKGHTAALVASALAIVPCWGGCCCLGLPIGIWSLIVLLDADVKSAFDRQSNE